MVKILILVLLLLMTGITYAVPVDPTAENGIAAMTLSWSANLTVLCTTGDVYMYLYSSDTWVNTGYNTPVPVSEIEEWDILAIKTTGGDYWVRDNSDSQWILVSPPCEGPIQTESETLGSVKQMFR